MTKQAKNISPEELIATTRAIKYPDCETLIDYLDLLVPNAVWAMDLDGQIYLVKRLVSDNKDIPVALECIKAYTCKTIVLQLQHVNLIY